MTRRKFFLFIAGIVATFPGLAVSPTAFAQDASAALVTAARAEGEVMFYGSVDEGEVKLLADLFEKRYGIKSHYLRLVSGQLDQRFVTENDNDSNVADVLFDSSSVVFNVHASDFLPLTADLIPNLAKWPKNWVKQRSVTLQTSPMVVTYNTDILPEADVPATWRDIADPKWKGKILLTDPRTSETYLGWLAKMESVVGADFIQALAKQDFTLIASGASGAQMIAAGAFPINLPTYASFGIVLKSKNAPINSRIMRDPTIVSESSVGVAAHAKHPNAARLFANFLLADDTLRMLCNAYPVSTPADPNGKLGCIGLENPQLVDYVPEPHKLDLIRMIGLASR